MTSHDHQDPATFGESDRLRGARFHGADLTGARFAESDLSDVTMRGVDVARIDIDAPWLVHGDRFLVNGVDVIGYVEAELDSRFPGRAQRRARDPQGLRVAWAASESAWGRVLVRAQALPAGAVEESVDGEWSFAHTLRHLVHATDLWFGKAVLGLDDPEHPLGVAYADRPDRPEPVEAPYADVLEARAGRVAMVRDYLASVTPEQLAEPRRNPHAPAASPPTETVLSCLQVILEEEWEHQRFAVRDLGAIESGHESGREVGREPGGAAPA
jgi:hypothetical protein